MTTAEGEKCTFCGKGTDKITILIRQKTAKVNICGECVIWCVKAMLHGVCDQIVESIESMVSLTTPERVKDEQEEESKSE